MAEPTTIMAGIGMGSSILGGIFGAKGASESAASANMMGMFQAGIAQLNARIARQNADYASVQGEQSAAQYGMSAAQRKGAIIVGQSGSGLDVNSGSARAVQQSQDVVSTMDMNQIRANAAKAAFDYRVQANQYDMQAVGDMMGAQNALQAGRINAASSIISAASSVADKWYQGRNVGLTPDTSSLGDPMQLIGAV